MYSSGKAGNSSETAVSFEDAEMVPAEPTKDVARMMSRVKKIGGIEEFSEGGAIASSDGRSSDVGSAAVEEKPKGAGMYRAGR
jgi:hypothetical protein